MNIKTYRHFSFETLQKQKLNRQLNACYLFFFFKTKQTLLKIKPNSNAFKTTPTLITITNADDTNNNNNTQFKVLI